VSQERKDTSHVLLVLVMTTSLVLTLWYATSEFIPNLETQGVMTGYDAFRYQDYARRNASYSLLEILAGSEVKPFEQMGYPILLSLVYSLTTPDPVMGCIFNWLLWVAAGFLLVPLAKPESELVSPLPFLALWMLYPDAIDWNGTTSKEPLVAFAMACALRICSSRAPRWVQALIVAALAGLMYSVRGVTMPLIVLALAISFEFRRGSSRSRWYRILAVAAAAVVALYVAGGDSAEEGDLGNPLADAGYARMEEHFSEGLSGSSVLRRMGSPDRVVDFLYVPIRGLTHLISPLYMSPLSLPFAQVASLSGLLWLSAGVCSAAALAIFLGLLGPQSWTRDRAILMGVLVFGLIALGLSGLIHERYRSIVVAALLPLGVRSLREEVASHGYRRFTLAAATIALSILLLYRILRQLS
jgi:hypothetical protein